MRLWSNNIILVQVGGSDYFIAGVHDRNRALAEDIVVIQVLPHDKWLVSIWLCSRVYFFVCPQQYQ